MHVYISDPALFRDLCAFLQRAGCIVGRRRGQGVEVDVPLAYSKAQARRELEIYVATWQAMNPGIAAYVVDDERES